MPDPLLELRGHWDAAKKADDPMAAFCGLATVTTANQTSSTGSVGGHPRVRTLILWDIQNDGLRLLTNSTSSKWSDLQQNPHYEALILWTSIQKQYRIRGIARALPAVELLELWPRKRYELKLLDHYYSRFQPQSTTVSRVEFMKIMSALETEFSDPEAVPMPETAQGLILEPDEIDVWDGTQRFPERRLFVRNGTSWTEHNLVP